MIDHKRGSGRATLLGLARSLVARIGSGEGRPLARLADVHPAARGGGRWIGLQTVPIDCVRGTTSTAVSRGQDFRPLRGREPADWHSRWSRLESDAHDQAILPPIQVLRAGGDYWVVDGHNRVALARKRGQLWIDADITELDFMQCTQFVEFSGSPMSR